MIRVRRVTSPPGEVDASPRAAGEGANIQRDIGALTRAKGATSPEGRGISCDHACDAQALQIILRIPVRCEHLISMLPYQRRARDFARRRFQLGG